MVPLQGEQCQCVFKQESGTMHVSCSENLYKVPTDFSDKCTNPSKICEVTDLENLKGGAVQSIE